MTQLMHPCMWLITWEPTKPIATCPPAIQMDGTWYAYGWDLTKNICEIFGQHGHLRTNYTYTPYGEGLEVGDVFQPFRWSSEYSDIEPVVLDCFVRKNNEAKEYCLSSMTNFCIEN